jgi:hypothetical protein
MCRTADIDPKDFIRNGASTEEVLRKVNAQLIATKAPIGAHVVRDEQDKYRDAASDALLMRGGLQLAKPAPGAAEMRGLSLKDLAIETLDKSAGGTDYRRMNGDDLLREVMRQYFSSTAAFPAILDDTINKSYRQGYQLAASTFETWTVKGTLPDFKRSDHQYLAGAAGEFLLVPEGAEIKHDVPVDHIRPGRQLKTYGRQFTMTREAFINDDIGFLTTIPSRYAASARRTLNKQV